MTLNYFITYFLILFFATIVPGPSMLLAINHGANHGVGKTVFSGLGNLTGNLLMALVSILGLGMLLMSFGTVFIIIKWIGVGYLVFIGMKIMFEPVNAENENVTSTKLTIGKKNHRLFFEGFFIAISNPKGILFFTALFPQFINAKNTSLTTFMIIFITLAMVAFGCYMLYAVFGVQLSRLYQLKLFKRVFNYITGSFFIGTGLTIAFSKK